MHDLIVQEVRYALRSLRRTPGFTLVAVLTLAAGIGANTAIFGVFNGVILRPLSYPDAERLYVIQEGSGSPANALHFREWRAATRSFENMALIGPIPSATLGGYGEPIRIDGGRATPSLFRMLGVEAALGRTFRDEEDVQGRDAVIVLGHELWVTRFGADPNVIGRTVTLDGELNEIVGVLPADFEVPKLAHLYGVAVSFESPQLWKPFAATARDLRPLGSYNYIALARLAPNVTAAQALDDLNAVQAELARRLPERAQLRAQLVSMSEQITFRSRPALRLVLAAVMVVLLIACVNITNLLLARGGRRQREFAIRSAAGAGRRRLVMQLFVESFVLSAIAGVAGITIGASLVGIIRAYAPVDVPRLDEVALDARVVAFTFAITCVSGLLIGVLPAWRSTKPSPIDLLRSSAASTASRTTRQLRSVLVGVEVAASVVCLVTGALLAGSFIKLMSVDPGFDIERIITMDFALPPPRYDEAGGARFLRQLTERARALPGVRAAGVTDMLPLSGVSTSAVMIEGSNLPRQQRPSATIRFADPGYFQTMGISLRSGRLLQEVDGGRHVAVVSEAAARRLWPNQDPLGKRFRHGPDDSPLIQVVGVVGDVRGVSLLDAPTHTIYRPVVDYFYGLAALAVKTTANPETIAGSLGVIVRELDSQLAAPTPRTMETIVASSVAQRRFQMNLVVLLALAAAFLAGLGIFAVISQAVTERTSEFGIRMAVGADASAIRRLVFRQGLLPVGFGLAAGIAIAIGLGQLVGALLFGVSPTDFAPLAGASLFLIAVAVLASYLPARRAMRINPIAALRYE